MNNPKLYEISNDLQKRDALQSLEEHGNRIKWKTGEFKVLDIGCGDGSVTMSILKQFVPDNCEMLVGCDISENMIKFANKHHASDHSSFMVLDIEGDLPNELRENFDHAFSFYALHWIKHQEVAFTNIYDLLTKGGDCFLLIVGHMPLYDVYRTLSLSTKWNFWMKDVDRFISPYHDCQNPEYKIKQMMKSIGFASIEVECLKKTFVFYSLDVLKRSIQAVIPFKIPQHLKEDCLEDFIKVLRDMRVIDHVDEYSDGLFRATFNYSLIMAYGVK